MVDEKELRVIHYTLGPLKPWDWWTSWLLKPVDVWQVFFFCTPITTHSHFTFHIVVVIFFLHILFLYFTSHLTWSMAVSPLPNINPILCILLLPSWSWLRKLVVSMQERILFKHLWQSYDLMLAHLQNVRVRLQESLPGTGGGKNPRDELLVKFLFLLPLLLVAFFYYRLCLQVSSLETISSL